jgi:hypothetical protein
VNRRQTRRQFERHARETDRLKVKRAAKPPIVDDDDNRGAPAVGTVTRYNGVVTTLPTADREAGGYLGLPRERGTYTPPPPAPRPPPAPQEPAKPTPWWKLA